MILAVIQFFRRQPVIAAVLVIFSGGIIFTGLGFVRSLFHIQIKAVDPTYLLVDKDYGFVAELEGEGRDFGYWPLPDTLPIWVEKAALAAEDRRFYRHPGIDILSVGRAIWSNYLSHETFSGASTIAMQLARLQQPGKRNLYNKISESFTALWLTLFFGRERVLRQYLTLAPYGNRVTGINYAARRYFKKPLTDLSPAEAGLLAALPKAPGRMNPYNMRGFALAKKRARLIFDRMLSYTWMDSSTHARALSDLVTMRRPIKELRRENTFHLIGAVANRLKNKDAAVKLNPRNPTLRLSLNGRIQERIQSIGMRYMEKIGALGAQNLSVLVLERISGKVLGYLGSPFYYDDARAWQIDFIQRPRSTGSLLKPFLYAMGLEWMGYTAATVLTDLGLNFGGGPRGFLPRNIDNKYHGPVLYKNALANSRNIPAIQLLRDLGLQRTYGKFVELGLTPDDGMADHYGLGLATGGLYTSMFKLARSYLVLANRGLETEILWFQDDRQARQRHRHFNENTMLQIQRFLSHPHARLPSFPRYGALEYPFPVAAKTGTSKHYRDAWTIAWSDKYLVAAWVGRHDFQPTKRLGGYRGAAPLARMVMLALHPRKKEGLDNAIFPSPPGYVPVSICPITGLRASRHAPYRSTEFFQPGTEPVEYSQIQVWLPVDKRNGLLASPWCPSNAVKTKKFLNLPVIYKDWALARGFELAPSQTSPLCFKSPPLPSFKLNIMSPMQGARIYIDPEMPESYRMLTLNCHVEPYAEKVLWFVDGEAFQLAEKPYKVQWPMKKGRHTFRARVPHTSFQSPVTYIEVL